MTANFTAAQPPTITTTSPLPAGTLSSPYPSQTLTATGGVPPYTWSVPAGFSLPPNFTLSSGGLLSGYFNRSTPSGSYSVTVKVTDNAGHFATATLSLTVDVPALLTSLAQLQDCIAGYGASLGYSTLDSNGNVSCQLAPGAYLVPFTDSSGNQQIQLTIGRSGIWIEGQMAAGPADVTLRRIDTSVNYIMTAASCTYSSSCPFGPQSLPVTGVTIEYLTFDGNRYGFGIQGQGISCLNSPLTPFTAQQETTQWFEEFSYGQLQRIDVYLDLGGTFTLEWLDFINSPDTALYLSGYGSSVSTSNFGQGGTGIAPDGTYRQELAEESATRFTAARIVGSNNGAWYNAVSYAGTAGLDFNGTVQYAYGNLLVNNRYEISDGSGGGQMDLDSQSSYAQVAGNVVNGQSWPSTAPYTPTNGEYSYRYATGCLITPPVQIINSVPVPQPITQQGDAGIEVNGPGHGLYDNEFEQHTGSGMAIGGNVITNQITISSANPSDSSDTSRYVEGNQGGGIVVLGANGGFSPNITGLVLDAVLVRNNAYGGVLLDSVQGSSAVNAQGIPYQGFYNGACLSGNSNDNPNNPSPSQLGDIVIRTPTPTTLTNSLPLSGTDGVSLVFTNPAPGDMYNAYCQLGPLYLGITACQPPSGSTYQYFRGTACPTPSWQALNTPAPSHISNWPW